MTRTELQRLTPGELVRNRGSGKAMIVHANFGDHAIAVKVQRIENHAEWDRVHPDGSVKREDEA